MIDLYLFIFINKNLLNLKKIDVNEPRDKI